MTLLLITARRHPDRVRFVVHLDTTKTTTDALGATIPDPEWTLEQVKAEADGALDWLSARHPEAPRLN